ncbi:MAG: carotenoid biosynthesis protein [Kiritimatiellae bacterium]|nr:carotenoid biosynthesis protein [Kiritimatiellia bacterium]
MTLSRLVLVLALVYAVLWVGGVVSYLFLGGPPAGAAWTAPAFLAVAALLALLLSPLCEWPILLGAAALGFAAEAVGVAFGFPFGRYHYTATLFPQVLGVPVVMAAAWLVLFAYVRQRVRSAPAAAAWMTAIDLVIDPLAAKTLNYWAWEGTGAYYGIPWGNFAGWFAVSLLLFALARRRGPPRPYVAWLGLSVVLFFTVIAIGRGLYLAGAIGIGLVTLHAAQARPGARRSAQSTPSAPTESPAR